MDLKFDEKMQKMTRHMTDQHMTNQHFETIDRLKPDVKTLYSMWSLKLGGVSDICGDALIALHRQKGQIDCGKLFMLDELHFEALTNVMREMTKGQTIYNGIADLLTQDEFNRLMPDIEYMPSRITRSVDESVSHGPS